LQHFLVAFTLRQVQCAQYGLLRVHSGKQQSPSLSHGAVVPKKIAQVVIPSPAAFLSPAAPQECLILKLAGLYDHFRQEALSVLPVH
jgi:hypothetical protein